MKDKRSLSFSTYNVIYTLWILCIYNFYFWRQVWPTVSGGVFVFLIVTSWLGLMFLHRLIFRPKTVKPLSILFLISNSMAGYFISSYHLVLNKTMLANIFDTNVFEATEWLGVTFWVYMFLFAVLPSFVVYRLKIQFESCKRHYAQAMGLLVGVCLLLCCLLPYKADVKVYLKAHFNLRYQFVPTGYISGVCGVVANLFKKSKGLNTTSGMVQEKYWHGDKKNLIVFVLGESARDANFSLSGYERDTAAPLKPYLKDMTVFHKTESCGVVTRVSLPCMFSAFSRENYQERAIAYTTNVLDIIKQNGFEMLWLDNELGCNKVCRNIPTEFTCKSRDCADILLNGILQEKIPSFTQDTFVVLHQRGSHGPRYDLRVPDGQHKWKPYCDRADHQTCTYTQMKNAYDNTIYYTSFVIADLISELSKITDEYNPILIYISDHGESLGEKGVYGHGGDFKDAPDEQKQVPFFVWMPKSTREAFGFNKKCLNEKTKHQQSQDVIFHSLMGLAGIRTDVYDDKLDIFAGCHR